MGCVRMAVYGVIFSDKDNAAALTNMFKGVLAVPGWGRLRCRWPVFCRK